MKSTRKITYVLFLFVLINAYSIANTQTDQRTIAVNLLREAFQKEMMGKREQALQLVTKSLSIDPDLAQANLIRAQFAVDYQEWETAKKYYERGLVLIEQTDQPLSPEPGIETSRSEVKGTAKCMLGLVYIMLSKDAHASGNDILEYEYLSRAKKQITDGLKLEPIPAVRAIAEDLLKKI
jgi:tetratricopeptide (TPR) repeat protein